MSWLHFHQMLLQARGFIFYQSELCHSLESCLSRFLFPYLQKVHFVSGGRPRHPRTVILPHLKVQGILEVDFHSLLPTVFTSVQISRRSGVAVCVYGDLTWTLRTCRSPPKMKKKSAILIYTHILVTMASVTMFFPALDVDGLAYLYLI